LDLETIAGAFLSLGLLEPDGERFRADGKRLSVFRELSPVCALEYLAAGSALYLHSLEPNPLPGYIHRSLLKTTALFINSLLASLGFVNPSGSSASPDPDGTADGPRFYPKPAQLKCGEILRREEAGSAPLWGFAGELPSTGIILKALEIAGLIIPVGEYYTAPVLPAGEVPGPVSPDTPASNETAADGNSPVIAMDSPFSLIIYPGISFADALDLALFCEVEETGTTVRFSLSRESVVRGFNRGFRAAYLWKLLERLSGGRAGEALRWNIEDWEKRRDEVALYQGVVLTLSGERGYLAESGPLAAMVRRVLAPGVFLLDASSREEAAEVLRGAGVDIVALPEPEPYVTEASAGTRNTEPGRIPFPEIFSPGNAVSVGAFGVDAAFGGAAGGSGEKSGTLPEPRVPRIQDQGIPPESYPESYDEEKAERLKKRFRACLESDGKRYSKEERAELLLRIERRLVVSESQLQDISIRYEKLEARSLDYAGKAAIAKQAIAQRSLLEIAWPFGGSEETVLGTPENLEKKGSETILVLRPRSGRAESIRIPLGKISVLRRIKQSIFGE
ncbi:MAG: hypothetical protein LBP29_08840, partial [Treponema sp.]|nr:hypothetical protein [Treponema sp.]